MAKKSKIVANERRKIAAARHNERRLELKQNLKRATTESERRSVLAAIARLPRDASPTRIRNRDAKDGRPRGHLRFFGLSRINVRELAHRGELPGVTKSSW
ncbi:MAG: 30S ribosomal protein S14 [Actinomycetota bacterium]